MDELRIIQAGCKVCNGQNSYTTTVVVAVDPAANIVEVGELVRAQAAKQIDEIHYFPADPLMVVVIGIDDITYALAPEESGE